MSEQISKILKTFTVGIIALLALSVVMGWPIMWLWNGALEPAVSSINPIGFWQAVGINYLMSIFFSGLKIKTDK